MNHGTPGTPSDPSGSPQPAAVPGAMPPELDRAAAVVVDARGVIVGWSAAAEDLFGYPVDEVAGRPLATLFTDPEALPVPPPDPQPWTGTVPARHRDGRPLALAVKAWPIGDRTAGGAVVLAYAVDDVPWWQVDRAMLEQVLARSPVGIAVLDTDLRYVWANAELERLGGVGLEERLGRTFHEIQPLMHYGPVEEAMRQVLETGRPVLDREFTGRVQSKPHQDHAAAASIFRIQDAAERVRGICYMVVDATDRWRARQRLALLSDAGEHIGTTLDVFRTAQELADFAVPRLADFVTVDLFDQVFRGEEPPPPSASRALTLRRAAHQSVRPGVPEAVVAIGDETVYPSGSPVGRFLADGRPHLERVLDRTSPWLLVDPARAASVDEFDLHSYMSVPVRARHTTLGVVGFVRSRRSDPFEREDLALAGEVVARGALSIDNARRFTREHTEALTLQRSLLPRYTPASTDLEVATRYFPAAAGNGVGGDWFDVIPLSGARLALVIGDVVGHGVTAAATMGRLRTAVRALADMDLPPDELLAHLDDLVIRFVDEETHDDYLADNALLGSTCLVAVLDPITRRCTMARAGHPPPVLVGPDGTAAFVDLPAGPPLGLGLLPFETAEVEVPEGGLLALYSDGVAEGVGGSLPDGLPRLLEVLSGGVRTPEEGCQAVEGALTTTAPRDDVALLVASVHALDPSRVAVFDIDPDPAAVAGARADVARRLEAWGLGHLAFATELIVSELVTNAIRYGTPPVHLRLIRHSTLICEVVDGSNTSPRLRHARTTDEGGRGLFLVAQLSKRWGTRYVPTGKAIWAEQELTGVADATLH
ncbi:SpoIIE family protein phosphatase [Kitasatospora sp. NPDC127111]|uniref:SpoIIE family protein phosphatase n=1 Tax=Kitasatospora sp. NPDC127111 TaxID=3345363 RepID=UPI00363A6577